MFVWWNRNVVGGKGICNEMKMGGESGLMELGNVGEVFGLRNMVYERIWVSWVVMYVRIIYELIGYGNVEKGFVKGWYRGE